MQLKPYERKPHFYETDKMGIVHHSNYIRWMEEARIDFMEQIGFGYDKVEALGVGFMVTGVQCTYKSPIAFGDTVVVESAVTQYSPARMTVSYVMRNKESGKVCTIAKSNHCYVNMQGRPVSLKKTLPEVYALFEEYVNEEFTV